MVVSKALLLIAGFVGLLSVAGLVARALDRRRSLVSASHVRGRSLQPSGSRSKPFRLEAAAASRGLLFGRRLLPIRAAHGHFAFVGATGSGKTILQRLLLQSVVPGIGAGLGNRVLIYDAKQDVLPILAGLRPRCPVRLLHPLDARAAAWDLARDITSPHAALQVASLLIPQSNKDTNPFFSNAARHLLFGVLTCFLLRAPGAWTFRQLLLAARDAELLRLVLSQEETTRHLLQYFEHPGTFQNIVSTILTWIAPYETIAATWDQASTRVSLCDWLADESILVLGNDEAHRVAVDTLNRLIFQRLTELILTLPEPATPGARQTWLFLDEVREMGKLDGLSRLLTKSRTAGAAVVLGLQDVSGLRDVYGTHVAEELLAQCNTKAILRLNGPETARWASRLFGSREVLERARSQSQSRNVRSLGLDASSTQGESESGGIVKRDVVLDSEFLDLPETTPKTGLTGFFLTPALGAYRDCLPGEWIARTLVPADPATPNAVPRPDAHQYLRPWGPADLDALHLDPAPSSASPTLVRVAP